MSLVTYQGPILGLMACILVMASAGLTSTVMALPNDNGDKSKDVDQLVREVAANELKAQEQDQSLWQYREIKEQSGETQLSKIVETKMGSLYRLVGVDGHALVPQQARKEDGRIQHLLSDPQALEKQGLKKQQDFEKERRLLSMLPDALLYRDAGQEGSLIELDFNPNPNFHPSRPEMQVFHHMEGSIWVDPVHKRLARISGHLISDVKFGGGILGHLTKGGTFLVEQKEIAKDHWELTELDVNMSGKALFFKTINVKQTIHHFHFRPVSAGTTLQEAAQMLQLDSSTFAESGVRDGDR